MARSAELLSAMNADIILREAHHLLQEISSYEEPKVALDETPSLAALAKGAQARPAVGSVHVPGNRTSHSVPKTQEYKGHIIKGQNGDKKDKNGRRDAILFILKSKGPSYIKDISVLIREVSEKTIQRELQALVQEGRVSRTGERRWTIYTLSQSVPDASVVPEAEEGSVDFTPSLG
jgi:hypothetical protein